MPRVDRPAGSVQDVVDRINVFIGVHSVTSTTAGFMGHRPRHINQSIFQRSKRPLFHIVSVNNPDSIAVAEYICMLLHSDIYFLYGTSIITSCAAFSEDEK